MKFKRWLPIFNKSIFFFTVIGIALIGYTSNSFACGGGGDGGGGGEGKSYSKDKTKTTFSAVISPPPAIPLTMVIVPLDKGNNDCAWQDIRCEVWLQQHFQTVMLNLLNSYYSMSVGNQSNPEEVELMSNLAARVVTFK